MELATVIGLIVGFSAIIGGQLMEGGHIGALLQSTAAIIVLGGTTGATLVSFPMKTVIQAVKDVAKAFFPPKNDPEQIIRDIVRYAQQARKDGLISLEKEAQAAKNPLMQKGITLVVDGTDPQTFRDMMDIELASFEEHAKASAEVFEAAGGFAPTIGIIGAVLGLIHVMENLSDASKLGAGIAVAFVATIYGLMTANIVCIPLSTKLKHMVKEELMCKEMIVEGIHGIQNGVSHHFIEQRLRAFLHEPKEGKKGK
ncbi:MAG TPA: flagellar motor protein [Desulfuromonadales bacterium]|nr:flagellar motor protein [Desulfuromonadales bacterium]